jgi:hypothetical protein
MNQWRFFKAKSQKFVAGELMRFLPAGMNKEKKKSVFTFTNIYFENVIAILYSIMLCSINFIHKLNHSLTSNFTTF